MQLFMKVRLIIIYQMEKENYQDFYFILFMKVILKMANLMEKENFIGMMGHIIKEILKMEKNMVLVFLKCQMENFMKEIL
jgi:hypothetical protein